MVYFYIKIYRLNDVLKAISKYSSYKLIIYFISFKKEILLLKKKSLSSKCRN